MLLATYLKDASGERLGAVRRTLEGESPLNQELAMRLLVRLARERREGAPGGDTSERARARPSRAGTPKAHQERREKETAAEIGARRRRWRA